MCIQESNIHRTEYWRNCRAHPEFQQSILLGSYCKTNSKNHQKSMKHKPKQLCNRTTICLSVPPALCVSFLLFGLSHTRNTTAHLTFIFLFLSLGIKSCRHNPSKTSGSFSGRTDIPPYIQQTKELRILLEELKRWGWGYQPAYRQLESKPNKKKKQAIHLKKDKEKKSHLVNIYIYIYIYILVLSND